MKRNLVIACVAFVLLTLLLGSVQSIRVMSALQAKGQFIKEALRAAPPDILQSNFPDGAKKFIETGELVFEFSYLLNPAGLKQCTMLHMRIHPRVSTHRSDGWAGIYQGNWYVKIY